MTNMKAAVLDELRARAYDPSIDGDPRDDEAKRFVAAAGLPPSVAIDEIVDDPVAWHWHQWLPTAGLVLLEGGVGAGKSCVCADWCARLSRGLAFPGCSGKPEPQAALWITAEERLGRHVRGRLVAAEADTKLVRAMPLSSGFDLTSGAGYEWLGRELRTYRPGIVVLDSLKSFLGGVDENSDTSVRQALNRIVGLANDHEAMVVGLRHWRKSVGLALERGGGSIAFNAMSEVVLAVGTRKDRRYLAQAKNRADERLTHAWGFTIEKAGTSYRCTWDSEPEPLSADQLSMADAGRKAEMSRPEGKQAQCEREIMAMLGDGPRRASEVVEAVAGKVNCAGKTVRRAAEALQLPDGRMAEWTLPTAKA